MTPILPLPPDAALTTPPSSDFLPRPGLDVRKETATTISGGLTQTPQGSDLQAKANDNTSESEDGMGSQMSRMTTTMILPIFVVLLVVIGGASLLWFRRQRRRARHTKAHEKQGLVRGHERLFRKIGRRARLVEGEKYNQRSGGREPTSVPVHEPDVAGQPPVQQIPERVLIRESLDVPKWLPELPSHQEISLHNSMATAPASPSRGSFARTNPTMQRLRQNLEGAEDPLPPPPQALFTRQSTFSSIYAESVVSSAPSSRPSTIVYASPLRPRPVTRRAPR